MQLNNKRCGCEEDINNYVDAVVSVHRIVVLSRIKSHVDATRIDRERNREEKRCTSWHASQRLTLYMYL